jgi:hypothetical protein
MTGLTALASGLGRPLAISGVVAAWRALLAGLTWPHLTLVAGLTSTRLATLVPRVRGALAILSEVAGTTTMFGCHVAFSIFRFRHCGAVT